MNYLIITNDTFKAAVAIKSGVRFVFIDMETLGKEERQKDRGAVFNCHTLQDVERICSLLPRENIMVRVNPIHENSENEINDVCLHRPGYVMLPYFKKINEVETAYKLLPRDTKLYLLFETIDSLELIPQIVASGMVSKIHLGLNDLAIEMGYKCIFKVLFDVRFLKAIDHLNKLGVNFGIGGVGKIGIHEIPAEMLITQFQKLGADSVILSRAFNSEDVWLDEGKLFNQELSKLNQVVSSFSGMTKEQFDSNENVLADLLRNYN